MKLNKIIKELEQQGPEVYEKVSTRRDAVKSFSKKVAVAALPLMVASMFKKTYGKTTDSVTDALNFFLEVEYLQYNMYHSAMATGNISTGTLIVAADRPGFQMIENEQLAHLNFWRNLIDALGATPYTPSRFSGDAVTGNPYSPTSYDFTAGGKYDFYTSYASFLEVAQSVEDVSVRAYLGQIPNLVANTNDVMTSAIKMSSVEARHASFIRLVRRFAGAIDNPKPWIANNMPPTIPLQSFYLGEDNTIQKGIDVSQFTGYNGVAITRAAATEAFDEPMDKATVLNNYAQFIIS